MKNRSRLGAAATSFAHLLGINPGAKKMEDDEDAKRAEESDEDEDKEKAEGSDEEDDGDRKDGKKSKHAEKDDEDEKAEDEDSEAEDDDDDDKEKAARKSERVRCARIIAHGIKAGRVEQAGVLAFDTTLTAKAAISVLNASASAEPRKVGLASRMSSIPQPKVGASDAVGKGGGKDEAGAIAAQMSSVYDRITGGAG